MPKELSDHLPSRFDLDDLRLPGFFSEIAVYLSLYTSGETQGLGEEEYDVINFAAEILGETSRDLRRNSITKDGEIFFWKFYGQTKEEGENPEKAKRLYADRLNSISEQLFMVHHLPSEDIEKLISTCTALSQATLQWWNSRHPTGFKRYAA
ncbi:MAG: hypothetical protein KKF68_03330 [Nanoarchaeota archaeon]|nr:hypothetical protein [Nanoarchaeota archaeon]